MPTRLLAIGDIHLGRLSSRLPALLTERLGADNLGPAAALRQAVALALAERVSAVLLAGDIADSGRDQYHALGVLIEVLRPLDEAGIPVLAVAGNHDHEVLPRLARAIPGLHILGAGGVWETRQIQGPGGPVRVLGWSFPAQHHAQSPAVNLHRLPEGPPAVGLLHADLDAPGSRYAPVRRHELAAAGACRWLLGHVHAPSLDPARAEPGYLGSLLGLDPTETGPRGPWIVDVEGPDIALRHVPLAPLRWDALAVGIDELASARDELPALVVDAMRAFAAERAGELAAARAVGLRLHISGRAADFADLSEAIKQLHASAQPLEVAPDLWGFIDRVTNDARPAWDLVALAQRDDPPGLLARELMALQEPGEAADLLQQARQVMQQIDARGNFQPLSMSLPARPADGDEAAAAHSEALLRCGYRILDDLLSGREAADGSA